MDDLIKDFLQESRENLDRLDRDFVKLEHDPKNLELLKSIFRTIHTIKGTCGFLGFTKLESLTQRSKSNGKTSSVIGGRSGRRSA
jgi:two-component system, chemotaxis family, sensor kinase CheA